MELAGFFFSFFLSFAIVLSDELMLDELMLSEEPVGALMLLEESVVLGELMLPEELVLPAGAAAVELEALLLGSAANAEPPSTAASAKAGTMSFSECI